MRKFVFMLLVGGALLAIGPASALARHHASGHHTSRHHSRVRFEHWGSSDVSPQSSSTGPSSSSDQNAGMVSSFTNNVLTITLKSDGSPVKGTVTPDTQVTCDMPNGGSTATHNDGDGGDQSSGSNDRGDNEANDENNDNNANDDGQVDEHGQQNCMTLLQTPGTTVREAELKITGAGATWDKVDLVSQQTTATNGDNDNDANENDAQDNDANDS